MLGYCNVGVVFEVGVGVMGFVVGDCVVLNGLYVDVVCVGKNLCVKVLDDVDSEVVVFIVFVLIGL